MLCCFANVHNNSLPLIPIADYLMVLYVYHFLLLNLFCPSVSSVYFPSVLLSSVCLSVHAVLCLPICFSFLCPSVLLSSVLLLHIPLSSLLLLYVRVNLIFFHLSARLYISLLKHLSKSVDGMRRIAEARNRRGGG